MAQRIEYFKDHLRAALTISAKRSRSRTRRTNEVPSIDTGSRFNTGKTRGLVWFLTPKHHLDTAVPLRSAISAMQITLQLPRPPLYSAPFCSLRIWTLPHLYSLTSLLSPYLLSPHPCSLHPLSLHIPYSLHLKSFLIPTLSIYISNLSSPLLSPSLISPHPYSPHL